MRINLPWPERCLHPNARVHWATKAKAAKQARLTAKLLTLSAMASTRAAPILPLVSMTFCPPNRRAHDMDGMLSACKSQIDGIADALGVNDRAFSFALRRGEVVRGGAVQVDIE